MQVKIYSFGAVGACPGMRPFSGETVESILGLEEDFPSFDQLQKAYCDINGYFEKNGFCCVGVPVKDLGNGLPRMLKIMTNGSVLVDHTIAHSRFGNRGAMELEVFLAGSVSEVDGLSGLVRDATELIMPYCKRFGVFNLGVGKITRFGSVNRMIHDYVTKGPKVSVHDQHHSPAILERLTQTLLLPKFDDYVESGVRDVYAGRRKLD
ncbi:hypothetical protein J4218_01985 [Candidatus Pacearchaeota archaeon]|nr:hypothetical protein [uncultured archaeon]AQS29121.1 hypothetical protein [uncultured archaeon]MBS3078867.1 hypothetical protein [Candidatus Pacearchaeota archaeon]